jgi:hypothetical protein
MTTPKEPIRTLEYAQRDGSSPFHVSKAALVFAAPVVMFFLEFCLLCYEGMYGDPPEFDAFIAYHVLLGLIAMAAPCWLVFVVKANWQTHRWVIVPAALCCVLLYMFTVWFLGEVDAHPAAEYYWSHLWE